MTTNKLVQRRFHIAILILFPLFTLGYPVASHARISRENAVVLAVRKVSPAVVNISTETPSRRRAPFPGFGDPFFDSFFRDLFESTPQPRQYQRNSLGSGVIIDGEKGLILTNAHVIANAGTITVTLKDEREFVASVKGADSDSDLAVLRIQSDARLPEIKMADSDDLMIGEDVIAIGNPFGFSHSVTKGVISALNRSIRAGEAVYHDFIQTDASINPGNSGGPLLNINGELIGVNTAIYARAQGIGFAIPISKAKRIVADLVAYGEVIETWIGITVQGLDLRLARYLNYPGPGGVLVKKVEDGSPASRAGIRESDVILSVGGIEVDTIGDFNTAMKGYAAGDRVRITLWRDGDTRKLAVRAEAFPMERAKDLAYDLMGVRVRDLQGNGVEVVEVRPQSYLETIGVLPGDIIRQMDEFTIRDTQDFEKALIEYRNKPSVVILLQRGSQGYYITVRF